MDGPQPILEMWLVVNPGDVAKIEEAVPRPTLSRQNPLMPVLPQFSPATVLGHFSEVVFWFRDLVGIQ